MKTVFKTIRPLALGAVLWLAGCTQTFQSWHLKGLDRDIQKAGQLIETAPDDARRAEGYSQRGRAYSEKARYSRFFKLISSEDYERVFALALKDHDQAVALSPKSAEVYYTRGHTYYDRAALEAGPARTGWFARATADFTQAIARDPRHYLALDRRGMVYEQAGDWDRAIQDYEQEMALDPLGQTRLADAHCNRGLFHQRENRVAPAIADYEKAIEIGVTADGCSCEPYTPLVGLYTNGVPPQYDKAWAVVGRARASKRFIDRELLEKLKKDSGRSM